MNEQMKGKYPPYDDRAFPSKYYEHGRMTLWDGKSALSLMNIDISLRRLADSRDNEAQVKSLAQMLGKAECEIKRLQSEVAKWKDNCEHAEGKAAHFEGIAHRERFHEFKVGDVIAYRNDEGTGWNCWEVGRIDERFLYEKCDDPSKMDNIAKQCAFLVKAAEDER